jgi:peptidoglycan/LPS O-acetylase OafA/YrhL
MWSAARDLAGRTPAARNRYVDFLRAVSITAVVVGHWLIAAPHVDGGRVSLGHMLGISPWTQWLSWGFQVMPVFFIVGGYSNGASWSAALGKGTSYTEWLSSRLQRLLGPLMPLLVVWTVLGLAGSLAGVSPAMIKIGSQAALVPIWFLAVYLLVVLLVPWSHRAWERLGIGSFWLLAVAAVIVDAVAFTADVAIIRWINYLFVWLAVHQLGYAWRDGWFAGVRKTLTWSAGGFLVLVGLMTIAGYPRSMVGVPGEEVSNTLPPTVAMLALGCLQGGLFLSFESPARRWLSGLTPWAVTVLVNGMIMTIYLWHLTVMVLVIGLGVALDGIGLGLEPGSETWWLTRPLWMVLLALCLTPFVAVFGRLERGGGGTAAVSAWRLTVGSLLICGCLATIAFGGIGGDGPLGIRWAVILPAFAGAALAGVRAFPRKATA